MISKKEIEIETLTHELESDMSRIEKEKCELEKLVRECVRYETGKSRRDEELIEKEKELESFKNSIPDFNQELCGLYVKYQEMKTDYERLVDYYKGFDERIERMNKEISSKEDYINCLEKNIERVEKVLKKAQEVSNN